MYTCNIKFQVLKTFHSDTLAALCIILKTLVKERNKIIYYPLHKSFGTWNDIGGHYMNQKHSEMPLCTLDNMLSLLFIYFNRFYVILKGIFIMAVIFVLFPRHGGITGPKTAELAR